MASYLFNYVFRRAETPAPKLPVFPYDITQNPYRCKRTWPPDFTQLSTKHQFRFERRYKRRTRLKWARPTWTKATKLAQWGSILFVAVYGAIWLEVDAQGHTLFEGLRHGWVNNGESMDPNLIDARRNRTARSSAQTT